MVRIPKTSSNDCGKPRSGLGRYLNSRIRSGTDDVAIGTESDDLIRTASMADVAKIVKGIRWLVQDWIPFGMVTQVVAEPGIGKSAFVLDGLARPIICGTDWFTHAKGPNEPGCVVWCDTEGSSAINVQRIKDWGLPADRIKVPFDDDPLRPVNLTDAEHLERIESVINQYETRLAVIDSLRGSHDGDENSSRVGQVLQRLSGIAERTGAAIVVVHHTRKLQVDEEITANSSRGSNAIQAMVRSQIAIDKPAGGDWCRVQVLKENLGIKPRPIGFRISSDGLEFGEAPQRPRRETKREQAQDWLKENMEPGRWYQAAKLLARAEFTETALRRARNKLGITKPDCVRKTKRGWEWMLPVPGEKNKTSRTTPPKTATP